MPLLLGCSNKFEFIYLNGDEAPTPSLLHLKFTINVAQFSPPNLLSLNYSFRLHFSFSFYLFRRGILNPAHLQLSYGVWPVGEKELLVSGIGEDRKPECVLGAGSIMRISYDEGFDELAFQGQDIL